MDTNCTRKVDGFPCRYELGHAQRCDVDWDRHYRNIEAAAIGSAKISRIINAARDLGLEVEVEHRDEVWPTGATYRSVSTRVTRPRLGREAANMLEVAQQAEQVNAGWSWIVGNGNTPKLYHASKTTYGLGTRPLSAKVLPYAIEAMAS